MLGLHCKAIAMTMWAISLKISMFVQITDNSPQRRTSLLVVWSCPAEFHVCLKITCNPTRYTPQTARAGLKGVHLRESSLYRL